MEMCWTHISQIRSGARHAGTSAQVTGRKQEGEWVMCVGHELGKLPAPGDDFYGELSYPMNKPKACSELKYSLSSCW